MVQCCVLCLLNFHDFNVCLSHDSVLCLVSVLFMCVSVNFRNFNVRLLHDSVCECIILCIERGMRCAFVA